VNASATFKVSVEDVTGDQRQVGKVQELACGFAGGVGAFAAMGRVYGLSMPESEAKRMVNGWRIANPWAMPFWQELETAYTRAMRNKGHEFTAGRITYLFDGVHLWYALPSGRVLCYPFARLEAEGVTYAKASWKPAADAKEWPRGRLWRGLACENVTQATAHDLLRHSLRQLEARGLQVIAHVHDETIAEHDADTAEEAAKLMHSVMVSAPAWAQGIPLAAEGDLMVRYHK
jgi:DNA polymerase